MAVVSWTDTSGSVGGTSYVSTNATQAVTASGSSLTFTPPAVQVKQDLPGSGTQRYKLTSYLYQGSSFVNTLTTNTSSYVSDNTYVSVAWSGSVSVTTSSLFKASNKTSRTATLLLRPYELEIYDKQDYMYSLAPSNKLLTTVMVTLNVPPTATVSAISYDTPYVYAGLTTASVTVSNVSAKYGGDVTDVTLTIGNQSDSISGNGTLSIALDTAGTFTPTVTVTDSRGQTKSYQLDPITVQTYVPPTVTFDVDRTNSSGQPDDEGTYCLITATLTFTDIIAQAIAPSVVLTEENGTQTTPTVNWYTDNTLTTAVTWANVSSGDVVYGIFSGVNTQYSYQVSVQPRDSEGTGTAIVQTVSSAFYTVDFLAGGHGIAFGKPAVNVGFECGMDATFDETLTAQDMTAQEVQDFVDNLNVGGGGVAVDLVVEQGTSGDWTYRVWASGKKEAWLRASLGALSFTRASYRAYLSYTYPTVCPITFTSPVIIANAQSTTGSTRFENVGWSGNKLGGCFMSDTNSTASGSVSYANVYLYAYIFE